MLPSEFEVPSREAEESRIATNWLHRLERILDEEAPFLFSRALAVANISQSDLDRGESIQLSQLDKVQLFVREQVPDITLKMYFSSDLLDLGLIGYAMASSSTVGKAFDMALRYHDVTSDRYQLVMGESGGQVYIRQIPFIGHLDEHIDVAEEQAGLWKILIQLLGEDLDYHKASAHFRHEAPEYVASYDTIFSCKCLFNEVHNEVRFPKAWLNCPVQSAHLASSAIYQSMIERVLGGITSSSNTVDQVRRLLLSRPERRMLSLEEAAELLSMSANQLRKRLYRDNTSYKRVILELRMTLARHYLLSTQLSIQEIGYLLDYAQPAPFSRAFKLFYGESPQAWRDKNRA